VSLERIKSTKIAGTHLANEGFGAAVGEEVTSKVLVTSK
jgi:hypothetical protein